jgi:excisionase family DNA binding protein
MLQKVAFPQLPYQDDNTTDSSVNYRQKRKLVKLAKKKTPKKPKYDWVNVKEACELLGVSRHTLHRLVQQELLPAYRVKGVRSFQFKREDVENLIEPVEPEVFHAEDNEESPA